MSLKISGGGGRAYTTKTTLIQVFFTVRTIFGENRFISPCSRHGFTSEDEYKWYWHQMIYFPEIINTIRTMNTISSTHSLVSSQLCIPLTLCMLASRSREGVVFLDFLPSSHSITSCPFPYLGSTDAPCSCLGDPVPPSPKWRPHSQGPRTLPYRDPEPS
jgi:hypothetical protein